MQSAQAWFSMSRGVTGMSLTKWVCEQTPQENRKSTWAELMACFLKPLEHAPCCRQVTHYTNNVEENSVTITYHSTTTVCSINYYCVADTWSDFSVYSHFSWAPLFQQLHYFTDDSLLITSKLWISLKNSQYLISTACCTQCLKCPLCSYALCV